MSDDEKRSGKRARKIAFFHHDLAAAAAEASKVANRFQQLAAHLESAGFTGALVLDGGQQVTDCLASLSEIHGKLEGLFNAALVPTIGSPESVPDSVPENGTNTRNNAAESRVSPQTTEAKKSKKTP